MNGSSQRARSLWSERNLLPTFEPWAGAGRFDVVVVGGGLTGLVTALLLSRAGQSVGLLEARHLGAGTTGNTTAKVSLLQGTRLSSLARKNPTSTLRAYVEANIEGQQWLLRYCDEHSVDAQRCPAVTYATTASGERSARRELEHALATGLDVRWQNEIDLPYATRGGVVLDDQAQFDPMQVLAALADDVTSHGGRIFEGTRVTGVRTQNDECTVVCEQGSVQAARVVLATGMPVLDRGGYFARLEPLRSYVAAFEASQPLPSGMYLSADSPTRSLRTASGSAGTLLLVGGNGHVVGRHRSPKSLLDDLTAWTEERFPGARRTHWWSAQDYESVDGPPYVGPLLPGNDSILIATGYDKWGMTNAVAASLALAGRLLGGSVEWAHAFRSWRGREFAGAGQAAKLNGTVALRMAGGWATSALTAPGEEAPAEGMGRVERRGTQPVAVCTVEGQTHERSAVCPHLWGVVRWNDAELSWDCPLHGSRFSATGEVLEGPAVTGLDAV